MKTVVAVGGTGQIVLYHYFRLYFAGRKELEPFKAFVVDTDEMIRGLESVQKWLSNLQYGTERTSAFGAKIPTLDYIKASPPEGGSVHKLLTGVDEMADGKRHPVSAFLARDPLQQRVDKGLFARPALSSVVIDDIQGLSKIYPDPNDPEVVLVGSLIGGTGGGLVAPIADAIRRHSDVRNNQVKLRAVLFGEYFQPDESAIQGNGQRFRSNRTLAFRILKDADTELHSFYIVGGPGVDLVTRNSDAEKSRLGVEFPDATHPYWDALQGLEYMLNDTKQEKAERFEDREVSASSVTKNLSYDDATQAFKAAYGGAQIITAKRVIRRVVREPWVESVWGNRLPEFIAHFWQLARDQLGDGRTQNFPLDFQEAVRDLWQGSLQEIIPDPSSAREVRLSPGDVADMTWPRARKENPNQSLFKGEEAAVQRAAASLLFWALRLNHES